MIKTTKKAILYFIISLLILVVAFGIAALIYNLTKLNNHNEIKYGIYEINLNGEEWKRFNRRELILETLPELNRLGPTMRLVDSGGDVLVLIDQNQTFTKNCFAGEFLLSQRIITLYSTCIRSDIEFKSTFMHEIGHSLGLMHICRRDREVNDCSPIGHGISIMNPGLDYIDVFENQSVFDEINQISSIPSIEIVDLDIKEFNRIWNGRRF
jgi:hypothetical protein